MSSGGASVWMFDPQADKILHEPIDRTAIVIDDVGLGEAPEHLDDPLPIRPDLAKDSAQSFPERCRPTAD
jgi:hypothetical protein